MIKDQESKTKDFHEIAYFLRRRICLLEEYIKNKESIEDFISYSKINQINLPDNDGITKNKDSLLLNTYKNYLRCLEDFISSVSDEEFLEWFYMKEYSSVL